MRYRGEDVMKIRSENGRIENFQGFKLEIFKFSRYFSKKFEKFALFQQKKILKLLRYRGEDVMKKRSENGKIDKQKGGGGRLLSNPT